MKNVYFVFFFFKYLPVSLKETRHSSCTYVKLLDPLVYFLIGWFL